MIGALVTNLEHTPGRPPPKAYRPGDENYEWHEQYATALLRFMHERRYREAHLGPFFRWLRTEKIFDLVSGAEQRKVFDELVAMDALRVEDRDTGEGYTFGVATLNYNHPLVRKVNVA